MCLEFEVGWSNLAVLMAPLLSMCSGVGSDKSKSVISERRIWRHCTFFAAWYAATYSASHVEAEINFWRLDCHATGPPFQRATNPEVERLLSGHAAKSASENPASSLKVLEYVMPKLLVL